MKQISIMKLDTQYIENNVHDIANFYQTVFSQEKLDECTAMSIFKKRIQMPSSDYFLVRKGVRVIGYFWGFMVYKETGVQLNNEIPGLDDIMGRQVYYMLDKLVVKLESCSLYETLNLVKEICHCHHGDLVVIKAKKYTSLYYSCLIAGGHGVFEHCSGHMLMTINKH